jgi:uncharacterized protein YndB with AHSA1/START domain
MRTVSHTLIEFISAPIDQVFALVSDPHQMTTWLPDCTAVETAEPLRKGRRLTVHFGPRITEFEIVDFAPPRTFGWIERGLRKGAKTFFQLDAAGTSTAVTIRDVWIPPSVAAWLRARVRPKRQGPRQLKQILENLRKLLVR